MKLETVINIVLIDVQHKIINGKFYINDIDLNKQSTEFGMPENVHTLSTKYAKLVDDVSYDEAVVMIENAIIKKYSWCIV